MEKKRKVYAPFSLTSEAGVGQTPVEGYIDVNQVIYPTVNTGTVNENGKWVGVKSDDRDFMGFTKAESISNGGSALFPDTTEFPSINMADYRYVLIAFKPTQAGNIAIEAVMGPDTEPFANLSPVRAAVTLRGNEDFSSVIEDLMKDSAETLAADVWNIYRIDRMKGQRNLQFFVTNNTGAINTIEFAFMRLV